EAVTQQYKEQTRQIYQAMSLSDLKEMPLTTEQYTYIYNTYIDTDEAVNSYELNLKKLGYVDVDHPSRINIFAKAFADKDKIAEGIARYNAGVSEEDQISYTDYVALLMSSITTIINAISYVLIAFVSVSLIVSSIMIAIITYNSVLERPKEIGILRALGASKKDVKRVFNAETFIIGLISGVLGIIVTMLLIVPINKIIRSATGISSIGAVLPSKPALILIVIAVVLTIIAGLIPSSMASRSDPVAALRSE
ncbi:MAG: FtsX-like permease family protein, partial [Erysipelotrichaceae bacterium]|nr:FtsX-like permease family protein [Erysipelotrichaceae bacterium]